MNSNNPYPPEADIIEPDIITVVFDAKYYGGYNVKCKGYSDSKVWIKNTTGGNKGYSYQWYYDSGLTNPIPGQTSDTISGLVAGKYYLRTNDRKSCMKVDSVIITEPDGMQLTGSVLSLSPDGNTKISCNGGSDGFIKLNITGGTTPYTYLWATDPSTGFTATIRDIFDLKSGTYESTVTDQNCCILKVMPGSALPRFTLTEPAALSIASTSSISNDGSFNINCFGGTGSINITVTGGSVGTYKYNWSTTNGSGIIDGQEDQFALTAGTYKLVVTDLNNCLTAKVITLTPPSVFVAQL